MSDDSTRETHIVMYTRSSPESGFEEVWSYTVTLPDEAVGVISETITKLLITNGWIDNAGNPIKQKNK